jgi:hypothetical protein
MKNWDIQVDYVEPGEGKGSTAGVLIEEEDGFYLIGCNLKFKVVPKLGRRDIVGLSRMEEGEFVDGVWKRGRVLNGDELARTSLADRPLCRYIGVNIHQ